jgi:hypothetical protein
LKYYTIRGGIRQSIVKSVKNGGVKKQARFHPHIHLAVKADLFLQL